MNETAIWVFTKIATSKDEPAELKTFVFKNEERAKESFLKLFESWENDNTQFKQQYIEHSSINTQDYIYRHYINEEGAEIIFSLEKFELKL